MAMTSDPREYMYRMEQMMRDKEREMDAKMRYLEQRTMQTCPPMFYGPDEEKQATAPKRPSHLNQKLLLTKGA